MVTVKVFLRVTGEPLKRTTVALQHYADDMPVLTEATDREGIE